MKKRALISVSDKTGIVEFAKSLCGYGYEIVSTGGTLKALQAAGIEAVDISSVTGFPECLDGRVKTLHPNVHAGLLAMRSNKEHMDFLKKMNITPIDIVVVNLYPFKQTISKPGVELAEAVENIDIGGPTMLRSAAKNYQDVAVIVDPKDYATVLDELANGGVTRETKFRLMYKVYQHTSYYDTLIANYLRQKQGIEFPDQLTLAFDKAQDMRYGENPRQHAVFYKEPFPVAGSLAKAKQLHGKELSYKERRHKVAYLMQNPYQQLFLPTVLDELKSTGADDPAIDDILRRFALSPECYVSELSYGKAKLLQAAVFLLLRRPFAIFDELDSALDYKSTFKAVEAYLEIGTGLLIITHDRKFASALPGMKLRAEGGQILGY